MTSLPQNCVSGGLKTGSYMYCTNAEDARTKLLNACSNGTQTDCRNNRQPNSFIYECFLCLTTSRFHITDYRDSDPYRNQHMQFRFHNCKKHTCTAVTTFPDLEKLSRVMNFSCSHLSQMSIISGARHVSKATLNFSHSRHISWSAQN